MKSQQEGFQLGNEIMLDESLIEIVDYEYVFVYEKLK